MPGKYSSVQTLTNPKGDILPPEAGPAAVSYSLDTRDQVRIFEGEQANLQTVMPFGAQKPLPGFSHEEIKRQLAESLEANDQAAEAERVRQCGSKFWVVECRQCGMPVAFPFKCYNRLCPSCSSARAELLIEEHHDILRRIRHPKMITLTFLSVPHIDREYLLWMRECFTKLRRRKVFKPVWGGLYSYEFNYSKEFGWHPHFHLVVGSGYIDQAELSREWEKITGARIVDIRAVKQGDGDKWDAIREVVKYPAKASTFLDKPELVDEFLAATKGVKLVQGFGGLYRVSPRKKGDEKLVCPRCGGTVFEWVNRFLVEPGRVCRYGDGYILDRQNSRAGPAAGVRFT